jgi:hypothetical protein
MIQANELRRGNIIRNGNFPIFVLEILHNGVTYDSLDGKEVAAFCEYKYLSPQELSSQLLEQCGFEFYLAQRRECFRKDTFYLHKTQRNGYRYGVNTHIKYLHQLQNLYFALTGSEITIKI